MAAPQIHKNFSLFRELAIRPCPFCSHWRWELRREDLLLQCSREQIEWMKSNMGIRREDKSFNADTTSCFSSMYSTMHALAWPNDTEQLM